ncbi:nucleotidyltransferase [Salinigranum marinum]|uniref:nucleotidyltransferase domain-containing protein n=1 Tax=Salinigranum marinum TaxID=1515595 RepID=UPI002989F21D|nr:nucleotidyltransferase [Salinigranum marinum]
MSIPNSKFDDWKGTGADAGSATARTRIINALEMDRSSLPDDIEFDTFLQGSYKNDTHTYGSSDVDVVVKLESAWLADTSNLDSEEQARYDRDTTDADYTYRDFRKDVFNTLKTRFNSTTSKPVVWDGKAIEINDGPLPVDVDVVPCRDYRIYRSYPSNGEPDIDHGMAFSPRHSTERIVNFPKMHYQNGTEQHANFKETVRIFKNARDYFNEKWESPYRIDAPSYFIECLIYNVPERILRRSKRSDRFEEILDHLQADSTDLTTFDQVSEMEPLFGTSNTQWDVDSAMTMLTHLGTMWNDWYDQHNRRLFT